MFLYCCCYWLILKGCPIRQHVVDTSQIVAEGEGLSRGVEDQVATFCVDSKCQRGDLVVRVDGKKPLSEHIPHYESNFYYDSKFNFFS